jgi:hypothetical protein
MLSLSHKTFRFRACISRLWGNIPLIYYFILCIAPILAYAQKMYVAEREYTYRASEDDSQNTAKANAIKEAQAELLLELGMLIESKIKVVEDEVNIDFQKEINIYTLGKVNTAIIPGTDKWDGHIYSARFVMEVDTAALNAHLGDIIKQKQQARASSLAKANKIAELESAVKTAGNLLEEEQRRETPLRIERDKKEKELRTAEMEKNNAQEALDRALSARPVNTVRIESERKIHEDAEKNYNIALSKYNAANNNWSMANGRVEAARRNLQTAENNLAIETNMQPISTQYQTPQPQPQTSQRPYYHYQPVERGIIINIGIGGMANFYFLDNKIYKDQNTEKDTTKLSAGPSVGLITGISFTEWLALYSEFYYTYRVFNNDKCSQNCTKIKEHALSIPLLIKMTLKLPNTSDKSFAGLYIEGGALFGIPLKTTVYTSSTYIEREKKDLGFTLGFGLQPSDFVDFGARFDINRSNYAKDIEGSYWSVGFIVRLGRL